ncbi:hypothetical protein HETIRDRAFT_107383 [Heterobasidion irregulare TC 32-1]|uniref:Uncharacterized protein n=1 Tax=Heterobasidion irregulare (strain TC 32-1) TaxID=747525 RepID=W4JVX4_HETIT|nr:uncharacterized protein HETIRDRAFT_107383 [Heterobasidion irregulare TC 32-1]ETW77713.1 hypothetical protein HETIRDRAFT_107383 [Heterobasidion irregulare TC 32-1]
MNRYSWAGAREGGTRPGSTGRGPPHREARLFPAAVHSSLRAPADHAQLWPESRQLTAALHLPRAQRQASHRPPAYGHSASRRPNRLSQPRPLAAARVPSPHVTRATAPALLSPPPFPLAIAARVQFCPRSFLPGTPSMHAGKQTLAFPVCANVMTDRPVLTYCTYTPRHARHATSRHDSVSRSPVACRQPLTHLRALLRDACDAHGARKGDLRMRTPTNTTRSQKHPPPSFLPSAPPLPTPVLLLLLLSPTWLRTSPPSAPPSQGAISRLVRTVHPL